MASLSALATSALHFSAEAVSSTISAAAASLNPPPELTQAQVEQDEAIAAAVRAAKERLKHWSAPSDEALKAQGLTDLQLSVTRHEGTEPAFGNRYWANHEAGIYVDVISGEPLYSSLDKFDSGTGWPSFSRALPGVELRTHTDYHIGYARTEMRSEVADSHLGHIFPDGPRDKGGMRHCANSASLRFIPVDKMDKEGFVELRRALFPNYFEHRQHMEM